MEPAAGDYDTANCLNNVTDDATAYPTGFATTGDKENFNDENYTINAPFLISEAATKPTDYDFTPLLGGVLDKRGTANVTLAPNDILGRLRPTGVKNSTVGCMEVVAAAGGSMVASVVRRSYHRRSFR